MSLMPFCLAQSGTGGIQIEAIEAHFTNAGIVPSLLATFSPTALMTVNFEGVGDVAPGTALTQTRELMVDYLSSQC